MWERWRKREMPQVRDDVIAVTRCDGRHLRTTRTAIQTSSTTTSMTQCAFKIILSSMTHRRMTKRDLILSMKTHFGDQALVFNSQVSKQRQPNYCLSVLFINCRFDSIYFLCLVLSPPIIVQVFEPFKPKWLFQMYVFISFILSSG